MSGRTVVRLRHEKLGGHRHVRVFVGNGKAGDLVFQDDELRDEWTPFVQALQIGAEANPAAWPMRVEVTEEDR